MHPAAGLEPIEGYKLVSRLGAGGYGEVWQATAPGGLSKAVKIVFGSGDDVRTQQELKSLTRIKDVRHPFLLSLDRFELRDGQLIIVMELAERSLFDRFEECRRGGLPGIPRRELLTYVQDAADALDYMNENFGLLHLDIKPQNLLLIGGRVKIADFGLVKNLRVGGTITGGITPAYATPEAFDGRASPQSDQYSLAIVYQEMLTGERPFPGTTALQLTIQHINSPPLLDALPPADRPTIGRALSKTPGERFASCKEMVAALVSGRQTVVEVAAPVLRFTNELADAVVEPARADPHTEDFFRPTVPFTAETPPETQGRTGDAVAIPDDVKSYGRVRPTVFLGIGGVAALALKRLKQKVVDRFGDATTQLFRFVILDTDKRSFRVAETDAPAESFFGEEILPMPLKRAEDYRSNSKELLRWLDRKWLFSVPKSQMTEGVRPFGRLAFVDHAEAILNRLETTIGSLAEAAPTLRQTMVAGMPVDSGPIRVVIVSSLVGGTGSGAVVDLGYAVRQTIRALKVDAISLGVLAFLTTSKPQERELAKTNAFATLQELKTWLRGDVAYPGDLANGLLPSETGDSPFDDCYLHHLGDDLSQGQLEAGVSKLAEYLFLDAASALGSFTHRYRTATSTKPMTFRSFAINRISVPRFRLAKLTSEAFSRHLIVKWCEYPGTREDADLLAVVRNQTSNFGLLPEDLATQIELYVSTAFDTDNRRRLNALLLERASSESMSVQPNPAEESTAKLLHRVHGFLGTGREMLISQTTNRTRFEADIVRHAEKLAAEFASRTSDWVVRWIEDPQERLYVAEKLAREFGSYIGHQSETARATLGLLADQRQVALQRLAGFDEIRSERSWLFGKKRDRHAERMELLLAYFELRLRELSLHAADIILRHVSSTLTDLSQDILAVRQRLGQFAGGFRASGAAPFSKGWQSPRPPSLVHLIKGESKNIADLAMTILESVMPEALFEFDVSFQSKCLAPAGGLWANVQRNDLSPHVKQALAIEIRRAMLDAFKEIDAAQLFLQAYPDPEAIQRELAALFEKPANATLGGKVHIAIATPASPSGEKLLNEIRRKMGRDQNTATASDGDIIVLFEASGIEPAAAAQKLLGSTAQYADFARKVLARTDIAWAPLT